MCVGVAYGPLTGTVCMPLELVVGVLLTAGADDADMLNVKSTRTDYDRISNDK